MNKQILKEIGLSDREIAVYVALLKIGTTTTGLLVKKSKVQNSKIYETLEKLIQKGLATYIIKGKIKHFQAITPKALLNFFNERKDVLQDTVNELEILQKKKEEELTARIYEGIKAIKSAFYEMYDYIGKNGEYCVFPIGKNLEREEVIQFFAQIFHKRLDMKIKIRTLPNINWKNIIEKNYKQYKLIKIRYINRDFPTGIFIFKNHLLSIIWGKNPTAFLIKSNENYIKWQKFFNEQWKLAKK